MIVLHRKIHDCLFVGGNFLLQVSGLAGDFPVVDCLRVWILAEAVHLSCSRGDPRAPGRSLLVVGSRHALTYKEFPRGELRAAGNIDSVSHPFCRLRKITFNEQRKKLTTSGPPESSVFSSNPYQSPQADTKRIPRAALSHSPAHLHPHPRFRFCWGASSRKCGFGPRFRPSLPQ